MSGSNKPQDLVDALEEQFGSLNVSGQGVWSELSEEVASELSESVFAIASFKGDEMRCSCSGIVIYWRPGLITLLTSASLVRSFHDESKIDEDLTIRVWNQRYQYVDGWLEQYDLHYNIALVNIPATAFLCPASLHHQIQLESGSKAGTGGPLVDFNGNFLGMNLYDAEQTTFLRRNIIIKRLERLGIFQPENKQGGGRISDILVRSTNNDVYLSANYHFDPQGNTRLFACTGILMECTSVLTSASLVRSSDDENKIDDDLTIEVRLPNEIFVTGKLQHCSLHYNLAVVNIMASPDLQTANLYHDVQFEPSCKVVAVGRIFASGSLTATSGTLTDEPSNFDCTELLTSTCIITKAGIGGPLVDFDGTFLGMNFYDEEKTPFIPRNVILECLRHFEAKRSITASSTVDCNLNRWPVPKPYWVYPASDWDLGMYPKMDPRAAPPPMLL